MIRINGEIINKGSLVGRLNDDVIKSLILNKMLKSEREYRYASLDALEFELRLRAEIVRAAQKLNDSRFEFAVFKKSECNPEFWNRTDEGGFKLKPGVSPFRAIEDILKNSYRYATECSTAIVIVFYLALTQVLPETLFNSLFSDIYLMNWKYLDKDLGVGSYKNVEFLPGDCLYFDNPDVNPETDWWQGENVIYLANGRYYGHGIGIRIAEGIIRILNQFRKPNATRSAYLTKIAVRPDYEYLYKRYSRRVAANFTNNH